MRKVLRKNTCIEWPGCKSNKGYGFIYANRKERKMAHRVIYEGLYGKIKDGLVIDHLCRNKLCINPNHLEAVTNKENVLRGVGITAINARKTVCQRGHKFRFKRNGERECYICKYEWHKKRIRNRSQNPELLTKKEE